jgi:hypothetical protein
MPAATVARARVELALVIAWASEGCACRELRLDAAAIAIPPARMSRPTHANSTRVADAADASDAR